jgi:hypothetical protein
MTCLPWLLSDISFLSEATSHTGATNLQTNPLRIFARLAGDPTLSLACMLLVTSLVVLRGRIWRGMDLSLGISALLLAAVAFFGTQLGLSITEPIRFVIPLCVVLTFWLVAGARTLLRRRNPTCGILASLFALSLVPIPPEFVCGYGTFPEATRLLNTLAQYREKGGRILLQDLPFDSPYGRTRFAALIPWYTGSEVTGTPFSGLPPLHPQFVGDDLFGQSLNSISPDMALADLRLYNVKNIVTYSDGARRFFDRFPAVACIDSINKFRVYTLNEKLEGLDGGAGCTITAAYGSIAVGNALSSPINLKYHYLTGMKVSPPTVKLSPIHLLDDPMPFIKIDNGTCHDFVITY